jgi:hypothetical protein
MELSTAISTASFMASCSVLRPLITWEGVCVWQVGAEVMVLPTTCHGTRLGGEECATSDNQSGPELPQRRRTLTAAVTFFQVPRHTMP